MHKQTSFTGWSKIAYWFSHIRTVLLSSYVVIILICIVTVGSVSFYISNESMTQQVKQANFQIVRQIELSMDNDFHNKRYLLLAPYYDQKYIDGINAYGEMSEQQKFVFGREIGDLYLKSFNTTPIEGFIRFQVYYSDGSLLSSSDNYQPWTPDEVRQQAWYAETVKKYGKVHFSGPVTEPGVKEDVAYASSILIRDFSNPTGFIVVRVEYNDNLFRSISHNNNVSEKSRMLVLNADNEPVYVSAPGMAEAEDGTLLSRIAQGTGTFWYTSGAQDSMVSYTRSAYSGWKTVLITPRSEISGPLDRIKTVTYYTAAAAFLLTALISLLFGRRITRPILSLYKSVNRVKRGDFSARAEIYRNDEIGRIAMNFNEMQTELQKLIESKYVYQIKLQEVELAMLYSQINPHFLYNTLDIVKAQADYYRVEQIAEMAQSLADMFRYNIKGGGDKLVTLRDELEQIASYMKIQRIRFEDKLNYELDIAEELLDFPLIKMTLQPLVENAVFHGIERKLGQGTIRLSAQRVGDTSAIRLVVADDGVGMPADRIAALRQDLRQPLYREDYEPALIGTGIGVRNVYARYAIRLGDRFAMDFESAQGVGTKVSLSIAWET